MRVRVVRARRLAGSCAAPGDKSISHRALIFAALAAGRCGVSHLAPGADVRSTARSLAGLGVDVRVEGDRAEVTGAGLSGLRAPEGDLDCGNSGTTMRLLSGVVAGSAVGGVLDGDESLRRRPMRRVLAPLRAMGAACAGTRDERGDERAPLRFEAGAWLVGRRHDLPLASAQVKSCLLLAGLFADGETVVKEPGASRDHTERMLLAMGAPLRSLPDGATAIRRPDRPLVAPASLQVPGDPSSAAFLAAAALLVPGGSIEIRGVDVNPTRTGLLRVLARMGAPLELRPEGETAGDPVATVVARHGELAGTEVTPAEIPSLVDEVPILAVLATQARGTTTIRGAGELRVKESDRLAQVATGLTAMGAMVSELPDGLVIEGPTPLSGAAIDAAGDHRIAMSFAVAGLCAAGETTVDGAEWADISFPGFFRLLGELAGGAVA